MSTIERFAVDVSGENFGGRLLMDATSQVPVRLTYNGADKKPESMTFADRRTVAGFELPHRISIVAGEQTLEDLVFDEVLVNPEIGKGDFKR
jgi:hypothetical protein